MKASKTICGLIAALALGLGVVACGSDDEESSGGGGGGGGGGASGNEIQKVSGAADKGTITVGSKNFPEQYILGNIYADALTAAGFKVKKSLDIGSEVLAYKSLQQGEIDGYPEYTGTVLTAFFEVPVTKVPKDPTRPSPSLPRTRSPRCRTRRSRTHTGSRLPRRPTRSSAARRPRRS